MYIKITHDIVDLSLQNDTEPHDDPNLSGQKDAEPHGDQNRSAQEDTQPHGALNLSAQEDTQPHSALNLSAQEDTALLGGQARPTAGKWETGLYKCDRQSCCIGCEYTVLLGAGSSIGVGVGGMMLGFICF